MVPFGPGVDVNFPNDPYLVMRLQHGAFSPEGKNLAGVSPELLRNARLIADPGERSFALERIAKGAVLSDQLVLAHQTLEEATAAASQVTVPLVRDQRAIAIVKTISQVVGDRSLITELLQESRNQANLRPEDARALEALPNHLDSAGLIRLARLEWKRAAYVATKIGNPTYRNEMLYIVVESQAWGSADIAGSNVDRTATEPRVSRSVPSKPEQNEPFTFAKLADEVLVDSFENAKKIDRLIWKYTAMDRIVQLAASSQQYSRGVELARRIENAELRAEALLVLADSQCRRERFVSFDEVPPKGFAFPSELSGRIYIDTERHRLVLRNFLSKAELDRLIGNPKERFDELAKRIDEDENIRDEDKPKVRLQVQAFLPKLNAPLEKIYRLSAADQEAATPVYGFAAEAVASIQEEGLRGVLADLLVRDRLIAAGRFDDARACIVLYPEQSQRLVALGAVAEAQGARGGAESARRWIAREVPEEYRPTLYRRVTTGVLASIEESRRAALLKEK